MTAQLKRPDRGAEMDAFLKRIGRAGATRTMLAADASFRRYERVYNDTEISVLMDAPPPWEDVKPFLQVTGTLSRFGVSVPHILASDVAEGFLLLEDLGDASFTRLLKSEPQRERDIYMEATKALVAIREGSLNASLDGASEHPPYDMAVYLREAALFVEWLLPQVMGVEKAKALRNEYLELWRGVLESANLRQSCLVHRDYHADNLFWLADRAGHHAVGMIDYQDALWGDPAYDLASLLEDARRDVADSTVADCFAYYATATGEKAYGFAARFAVLAAQRNAKIIGIFVRLCVRDGKAHYLDYLPRVWRHFMHDLNHAALTPIREFVEQHVPVEWRGTFKADSSIGGIVA